MLIVVLLTGYMGVMSTLALELPISASEFLNSQQRSWHA